MNARPISWTHIDTPIGRLLVAGNDAGLIRVRFPTDRDFTDIPASWRRDDAAFTATRRQIGEWFAGVRTEFDLPLSFRGNGLQMAVWEAMRRIPFGETRTYGEIAREISEGIAASRAVGSACGDNPLPVIIPCHRVVGAGGTLTGFGHGMEGGLELKRRLLDHEFRIRPPKDTLFALL